MAKFEQELKPCPYCGGKGKLKTNRANFSFNIGGHKSYPASGCFIRCEKCHARTELKAQIGDVVNHWNLGLVYPSKENVYV